MRALEGIDVEDTFVLEWNYDPETRSLRFEVEASLLLGHADYRQPKPGEWACYRRGVISLEGVRSVTGLRSRAEVTHSSDPDGSEDYGSFDTLRKGEHGRYHISGSFGEAVVDCERVSFGVSGERPLQDAV